MRERDTELGSWYQLTFTGNENTSRSNVETFFWARAGELALKNNYRYVVATNVREQRHREVEKFTESDSQGREYTRERVLTSYTYTGNVYVTNHPDSAPAGYTVFDARELYDKGQALNTSELNQAVVYTVLVGVVIVAAIGFGLANSDDDR